jgi:hypothetical protein
MTPLCGARMNEQTGLGQASLGVLSGSVDHPGRPVLQLMRRKWVSK